MCAEPSVPGDFHHQEPGAASVDNPAYKSLLEGEEYDRLAHLLEDSAPAVKSTGSPIADSLLSAARQLCQACIDCQEQEDHLQQLHKTAVAHECDLRQTLQVILILLEKASKGHLEGLSAAEIGIETTVPDETIIQPGFWHRVQDLLGLVPSRAIPQKTESLAIVVPEDLAEPDASDSTLANISPPLEPDDQERSSQAKIALVPVIEPVVVAAAGGPHPSLVAYCLGPFRAYINEILIDNWSGQKSKSIFKYLVTYCKQPIPIEILLDLFWHEDEPESARRNLYQTIYLLRQTLKKGDASFPFVISNNGCYCLNPDLNVWLDIDAFSVHYTAGLRLETHGHLVESVKNYEAANSLYTGNFLAEDIYEEWSADIRRNLKNAYLKILSSLCHYYFKQENWAMSIAYGQKILTVDDCREEIHRLLMLAYFRQGQRPLAVRQYHRCIKKLEIELNVCPMPETDKLFRHIMNNEDQNSFI